MTPDSTPVRTPARRLLILSTYYAPVVGGSETHARQIADYLRHRGWQVTVLTKRVGRAAPREEMMDGVRVVRVAPSGDRTAAQKWLMLPAIAWSMIRLRKTYDLVYSPDYRGIGIAGILVARLLRRPAAMGTAALGVINAANLDPALTRIGMNPRGAGARVMKSPFRGIYSAADAFPSITRAIQQEAVDAGIPIERAPYLPNSVDTRRFRPAADGERAALRQDMGWPIEPVICLFLARLSREKGLLDLLAAWKLLGASGTLLYVVGPDMPEHPFDAGPAAREYVRQHGLDSSVRFLGPTSEPERVLRAADVLVQPSHWEGAPFGVVEAIWAAIAVHRYLGRR